MVTFEDLVAEAHRKLAIAQAFRDDQKLDPEWHKRWVRAVEEAEFAQAVCFVAKSHGLRTAMVFKLSNGAIDPR
jgi:hypothetical protein